MSNLSPKPWNLGEVFSQAEDDATSEASPVSCNLTLGLQFSKEWELGSTTLELHSPGAYYLGNLQPYGEGFGLSPC